MNDGIREKILVVDDAEINRAILDELFCREYDILEAENGLEAIKQIEAVNGELAALLLDIVMPEMDGFGVLKYLSEKQLIQQIPVFLITAETSSEIAMQGYEGGVVDVITKPIVSPALVRKRVNNAIELYRSRRNLSALVEKHVKTIREQSEQLKRTNVSIIDMLSSVIEFRSGESGQHVRRIRHATQILLTRMQKTVPQYRITDDEIDFISNAAAMHDIGKISVPDYVLNKPGRLTKEEFEQMKKHTVYGCGILEMIPFFKGEKIFSYSYDICRHHHERWDGRGYPDGLKGDEISIGAQVVSIADVYDALVSERVYKKAFPREKARDMIAGGECGCFNPLLVQEFLKIEPELYETMYKENEAVKDNDERIEWMRKAPIEENETKLSERTIQLLEMERKKYQILSELSGELLFDFRRQTDAVDLNERFVKLFGGSCQVLHAADYFRHCDLMKEEDKKLLLEDLSKMTRENSRYEGEFLMKTKSGRWEWFSLIFHGLWGTAEDECAGYIGKMTSIHDLKEEANQWKKRAMHDYLTGLFNRQALESRVHEMLTLPETESFTLFFIDVDNFKLVNDLKGHLMGDLLLKDISVQLQKMLRSTDMVARLGGDEFAILLQGMEDVESIKRKAKDICQYFISEKLKKYGDNISCSIGISCYPQNGEDYKLLLDKADKALYMAKNQGKSQYVFYNESQMENISYSTVLSQVESDADDKEQPE